MAPLLVTLVSLATFICAADGSAARRVKEAMRYFSPDAARRFLADMRGNPGYDYAQWAPKVEALIAHPERAEELYAGYRAAMLANPVLDFDRILCVRRITADARTFRRDVRFGNYRMARSQGFYALNAHNHMDMGRQGFTNEIVCLSNLRGEVRIDPVYTPPDTAIVRDLDIDFDASRLLFTSCRGTNDLLGVYEIALGADGTSAVAGSRVLVSPSDDLDDVHFWDGCYLPNRDQVILLGTAGYQYLPCEQGNWPMCGLYRLDRRTGEMRQLTFDQDSSYSPAVTHDGRVMYTRWEYSDLPHYFSRELMTMNPDGVGQLALWGSGTHSPTFFAGALPVPGEAHLLTMFAGGHHGRAEMGRMLLVDPSLARTYPFRFDPPDRSWGPPQHYLRIVGETLPAEQTGLVQEFPGWGQAVPGDVADLYAANQYARGKPYFSYPRPLSRNYHLATMKPCEDGLMGIWLVDAFDNLTLIAEVEGEMLLEPVPWMARRRPPVIPDRSDPKATTCSVHIADIYQGPGLAGVPRGTVKQLRVFSYHYAYHLTGGHSSTGLDLRESSWDVKRILGTVDVEADGSCCFEMPARLPVSFQPLDEKGRALQLMRSWTVGQGGERVSCTGCHEDNRASVPTRETLADRRYHRGELQRISPTDADGIRPWGFAAELWPVIDRKCTTCHGDAATAPRRGSDQGMAGEPLAFADAESAYRVLSSYVRRPGAESEIMMLTPLDFHATTSPLVQMLEKGHPAGQPVAQQVVLSDGEWRKLHEWIDLNTPFHGQWKPKPFAGDKFLSVGTTNQAARRLALARRFNGTLCDPEAEFERHAAKVAARHRATCVPRPNACARAMVFSSAASNACTAAAALVQLTNRLAAYALQAGSIDEVAPVTTRRVVLGGGQSMVFRRIPASAAAKPFWLGETEVRNDQYKVFDPQHDSRYQDMDVCDLIVPGHIGNHRRMPVVRVSWQEAQAFCAWLSGKLGVTARLPTEEEWEWAARAGSTTPFPWGEVADDFSRYANLADRGARFTKWTHNGDNGRLWDLAPYPVEWNWPLHEERWQDDWHTINFVARALPNLWGLYDMHGNACEWTASDYDAERKVVRGGSFASRPRDATSSWRWGYFPWQKVYDVGFRVVLEISEKGE